MRVPRLIHLSMFTVLAGASCRCAPAATKSVQTSVDETRFNEARAQTDPTARAAALEQYLQTFPAGSRHSLAQRLLLETLLSAFADQTGRIRGVATDEVHAASPGVERWIEEARVADQLADAGVAGIDLEDALVWANDAVASLTEVSYKREAVAAQVRYSLPKVPLKQLHDEYVQYRVSFLAALANVDLRRKKMEDASALLAEAFRLQPLSGEVNSLRGQLALAKGDAASALESLERANALEDLQEPWRDQELRLFRTLDHGDKAQLDSRVDELSRTLYPPLFALPERHLPPGGHTALLELFTGSGCLPCAGPDLAVDSLLGSYGRQDLAVLEYDEHIPRPDPLANPDSVARASLYGVSSTPVAFLDGEPLQILGASRHDVENIVVGFADEIEDEAMLASGLRVGLSVTTNGASGIIAQPTVALTPVPGVQAEETTGEVSFRTLARAVLYVALVQDGVRYSGENGIRLHRMVVRSLVHANAAAYLNSSPSAQPVQFRPADLERAQQAYLSDYQRSNDRFGNFRFTTTDIPFREGRFAVVAWVQDPATRRILQATYADLPAR